MVLTKKAKRILIISTFSIGFVFCSLVIASLQTMHIEYLISHADNNGKKTEKSDILTHVSKFYLENFRITENEAEELQASTGVAFILAGFNDYKYQIAEAFLEKGLDINGINHSSGSDLTALHSAVLLSDKDAVLFLLEHGIDISVKSGEGLTALDWAIKMQEVNPTENRDEIVQILEAAINS
jgi:ankyrin repeat protein